jgi:hypothetical protein
LVAFAAFSPPVGGIEGGEQGSADISGAEGFHRGRSDISPAKAQRRQVRK